MIQVKANINDIVEITYIDTSKGIKNILQIELSEIYEYELGEGLIEPYVNMFWRRKEI